MGIFGETEIASSVLDYLSLFIRPVQALGL